MEPAVVIAAFGAIASWLELAVRHPARDRAEWTAAVEAIHGAAVATRGYAGRVSPPRGDGTAPPDPGIEEKLAHLWMTAGLRLSAIDLELAEKCAVRGGYWIEPDGWTESDRRAARIALETIIERAAAPRA